MKKILVSLLAGSAILLTSCFETTQEITLNADGSGTYVNTSDMSKILTIAKNMALPPMTKFPLLLIPAFHLLWLQTASLTCRQRTKNC